MSRLAILPAIGIFDSGNPDHPVTVLSSYGSPFYFIGCEIYTTERLVAGDVVRTTNMRGGIMSADVAAVLLARPDRQRFERPLAIDELQKLSQEIEAVPVTAASASL